MVDVQKLLEEIYLASRGVRKYPYCVKYGGFLLVNATPHELKFNNGITLEGNQELAEILKATPKEELVKEELGIRFVRTTFEKNETAELIVSAIKEQNRRKPTSPILLISSIISAQAYGFPVVSPITTPETSRKPPSERIVYIGKFNVYKL